MAPNFKPRTGRLPQAISLVVEAHAEVTKARASTDAAKEVRRKAIVVALTEGATLRALGQELGVSAQAVQAMAK